MQGQWITTKEAADCRPISVFHRQLEEVQLQQAKLDVNLHVLFRKKFQTHKKCKTIINITADDYYKLYINGSFVTQGPAPGFPFHYYYNKVDITPYIIEGENTIAVHTYYQGLINRVWVSGDDRHGLWFQIIQDDIVLAKSDESVKCAVHTGYEAMDTVGYQTQFMERYDSRSRYVGFEQPDYDDHTWQYASVHSHADYKLFPQPTAQLEFEEIQPVAVKSDEKGYFLDFGSVYVGYLSVTAKGNAGDKISIFCGQELTEDKEVRFALRANCRYEEEWILSGDVDELKQYDYKAFRYCKLTVPEGVSVQNIKLIARHYPFILKKQCEYQDEDLLRIWNLCVHSLKYGVQEVIQDCMEREKGQYLGDGSFSSVALAVLTGDTSMMEKLIDDALRTDFINEGLMTCSPCSFMQEIAEFPLMLPQLFLMHWKLKKDAHFIAERFEKLAAMLKFYEKNYAQENGLLANLDKWCVVDWPMEARDGYDYEWEQGSIARGTHNVINAYYIGAKKCVYELAKILSREDIPLYGQDSKRLTQEEIDKMAASIKDLQQAYMDAFYDAEQKLYCDTEISKHASLPSNVLALMYDLCPDKETEERIVQMIMEKPAENSALFISFASLCGLARLGRKEEILAYIRHPGRWLRMLEEGATTTFEAWGKDAKWNTSLFHLCYTYPVIFLTDWLG